MPYSHYPHGFVNGVAIREQVVANIYSGKANVFWVDSNIGSDGNKGTFSAPFATLDYAIGRCTANNGDIIMLAEGHSENISSAAAVNVDVDGISIIGVGTGNNRPTFTFDTSTSATFAVNADDVYIYNLQFLCAILNQTIMLDLNGFRAEIAACYFGELEEITGATCIDINGGASFTCDGTIINGCEFECPTAGNWDRAIELGEAADNIKIINNLINGDFDDAGIHNPTAKVLTNMYLGYNSVRNLQSGQHAVELVSAVSGKAEENKLYADAYATTFDPGALYCVNNYAGNAIDTGSVQIPAAPGDAGSYFWIKKTFVSSAITTTPVDMTSVSTGGELAILMVIFKTDSTGLAGGNNFQVITNNANGTPLVMAEDVTVLGANKSSDIFVTTQGKVRTVLELGKKIQVQSTDSNCTGAGTVDVYIQLQRLSPTATVATV